jgi:hypothetical protein
MDKTPFSKKCEILFQFYLDNAIDPDWSDFIATNDLGFPAASLHVLGAATLNEIGIGYVEDVWQSLCGELGIDYHATFENLQEMMVIANG